MNAAHVWAVYKKQNKDTVKNKAILIQFVIFPIMAFVLEYGVEIPNMAENYFVALFAVMFLGMAPLTAMSSLLSEEKETCTLRMLNLAGVTPVEYMLGAGGSLLGVSLLGTLVFAAIGGFWGIALLKFFAIMTAGILISFLIGAVIGLMSRNQSSATSITVPVMMVFSFLPMLAMFNKTIAGISKFTYTGQIHRIISEMMEQGQQGLLLPVLGVNALVAGAFFLIAYKKNMFSRE